MNKDKEINYKGNPLLDFSLMNFLDRFSFKNAKTKKESAGFEKLLKKGKIRMSRFEKMLEPSEVIRQNK
jgi:hypothetical protein